MPAPKTYTLLLKIAELSQYYLTSSSLQLRIMILSLLQAAIPPISLHEDSFLPLVNKIWPVLLPRIYDSESLVVTGALNVIAQLCQYAGDFMSGRIDDAWAEICALYDRAGLPRAQPAPTLSDVKGGPRALPTLTPKPSHGSELSFGAVMPSLVRLLMAVANNLSVKDHMSDDLVDMLTPFFDKNPQIVRILEARNPDAVWLALQLRQARNVGEINVKLRESLAINGSKRDFAVLDSR
jgi:hypothetical protein